MNVLEERAINTYARDREITTCNTLPQPSGMWRKGQSRRSLSQDRQASAVHLKNEPPEEMSMAWRVGIVGFVFKLRRDSRSSILTAAPSSDA